MTSGDLSTDVSLLSMMFSQGIKLEDLVIQEASFNTKDLLDKIIKEKIDYYFSAQQAIEFGIADEVI